MNFRTFIFNDQDVQRSSSRFSNIPGFKRVSQMRALTWDSHNKRWKKKYKGKQYYLRSKGYEEALREWQNKKVSIDLQETSNLASEGRQNVNTMFESFLAKKASEWKYGHISASRLRNLRNQLKPFVSFCTDIDSPSLLNYYTHLVNHVSEGTISVATAQYRMQAVRQFVKFCYTMHYISDLPRILESSDLRIQRRNRQLAHLNNEDVSFFIGHCSERLKLHVLLMLNCGMTQQDLSDLTHEQVDWDVGRIVRKRSKTCMHNNVPTVNYLLWPDTFQLLKKYRREGSRVLRTRSGGPLRKQEERNQVDSVGKAVRRLAKKIGMPDVSAKWFRRTGANRLTHHPEYYRFHTLYLGHSPKTIAERHYVVPSQQLFDDAIEWLGTDLGIT